MSVTIKDIANKAGVSIGTVDRALNHRGRINPEVAERIRNIAESMNYRPNTVAKSLVNRSKNLNISVVLHVRRNSFFDEVEQGIQDAQKQIADFGIHISIYRCLEFDANDQLRQIDLAVSNGASAIILVPIDDDRIRIKVNELAKSGIPVAFLVNFLENADTFSEIRCNHFQSGRIAAGLFRLLAREPGEVLVFSPSFTMLGHRQRVEGFRQQLAISCPQLQICDVVNLPASELDAYQLVTNALREHPCKYLLYNGTAKAGMRAIRECGYPIVSVFFDMSSTASNALQAGEIDAVIFQNPRQQGFRAVFNLFEYLTSNITPKEKVEFINCQIFLKECMYDSQQPTQQPSGLFQP